MAACAALTPAPPLAQAYQSAGDALALHVEDSAALVAALEHGARVAPLVDLVRRRRGEAVDACDRLARVLVSTDPGAALEADRRSGQLVAYIAPLAAAEAWATEYRATAERLRHEAAGG